MSEPPFWESTPLTEMSQVQWESLCDGCGRCCLHKLLDEDTGDIHYTSVVCRLLDQETCRCSRYGKRQELVPDCVVLSRDQVGDLSWLPDTCAYRVLASGGKLATWHPLVSGDPHSVHRAGISVRGRVLSEEAVHEDDMESCIITWVPSTRRDC